MSFGRRVTVVGAGIVGVCCALYLQRDGHEVTLLDRDGPGEGTSKGNAGALSPGSCVPLAMPGVLRKVPGWLLDRQGPLTIRPSYLPRALPWLLRFLRAADPRRVEAIADALRALHGPVFDCYRPLVETAGCADLIRPTGTLIVFRSAAAFEASGREWRMRRERGAEVQEVHGEALRTLEPALGAQFTHGALLPEHGFVADPYRLVTALAADFAARGGHIERAQVRALRPQGEDGVAVICDGREVQADRVVVAAGAWSGEILRSIGVSIPLETQRGYHVTLADPGIEPQLPVSVAEDKYYATPMEGGLRVAGTVEFAGLDAAPDFRRARHLLEQVRRLYPQVRTERFTEWMGHRPCLPDSLPAIGWAPGVHDVVLAFGHGHNGMTSGPVTGRLVADLLGSRPPLIDLSPYDPSRF